MKLGVYNKRVISKGSLFLDTLHVMVAKTARHTM
jgi:hypothetical protein